MKKISVIISIIISFAFLVPAIVQADYEPPVQNVWEQIAQGMTFQEFNEKYGVYYSDNYYIQEAPEKETEETTVVQQPETPMPLYDYTTVIVDTESLDEEDLIYLDFELDGSYVLSFDSEEKALEILEKYEQREDAEACYDPYLELFDSGEEYDLYQTRGLDIMHSSILSDVILEKYGSVEALASITVGIIDSGINYYHSLLSDRVQFAKYDYYDGTDPAFTDENGALDEKGHGSHVAGIIADLTLPNVRINAYKITSETGKTGASRLLKAIDQAISDHVDILNLSLGGTMSNNSYIQKVFKALDNASQAGILIVIAAGNSNVDISNTYPANYKSYTTIGAANTIVVSALASNGTSKASFSNYGDVDLCAPGASILSSYIPGSTFGSLSGTSMATPAVVAAAALVKTLHPEFTAVQIKSFLQDTAYPLGNASYFGAGRVDLNVITQTPVFETAGGEYDTSIQVTVSDADTDAQIFYTLDGSMPDTQAGGSTILYTGPINISNSTEINAVAVNDNLEPSQIISESYYINGNCIQDDFTVVNGVITAYTGSQIHLTIPEQINAQEVTSLAAQSFACTSSLQTVTIPEHIVQVGTAAFYQEDGIEIYLEGNPAFGDYPFGFNADVYYTDHAENISQLELYGYDLHLYDHSEHIYEEIILSEPTCTAPGLKKLVCKYCGEEKEGSPEEIPALGHSMESREAKAPSCSEIGWESYEVCTVCGYNTYSEHELPKLNHDYQLTGSKQPTEDSVSPSGSTPSPADLTVSIADDAVMFEFGEEGTDITAFEASEESIIIENTPEDTEIIDSTEALPAESEETYPEETQSETPEETYPAETLPEETDPAETLPEMPEETYPAETLPEETNPEETQPVMPEETYPAETLPEETNPDELQTETIEETDPEESQPETIEETYPEETQPEVPEEIYTEETYSEIQEETYPEETHPDVVEETYPIEMQTEAEEETYLIETQSEVEEETYPIETLPEYLEETYPSEMQSEEPEKIDSIETQSEESEAPVTEEFFTEAPSIEELNQIETITDESEDLSTDEEDEISLSNAEEIPGEHGWEKYECSSCGAYYYVILSPQNHVVECVLQQEPDCTEPGISHYSCTHENCSFDEDVQDIPAEGHSLQYHALLPATQEQDGNIEYWTCSTCGLYFIYEQGTLINCNEEDVVIDKLHVHSFTESIIEDAGCTESGILRKTCECGYYEDEIIPAEGHTLTLIQAQPATCSALGHTEEYYCSVCHEIFLPQTEISKTKHNPVAFSGQSQTCSSAGLTRGVRCADCSEILISQTVIPAGPHYLIADREETEPTCTAPGMAQGFCCSYCQTQFHDEIPPLGHSYSSVVTLEPTCTAVGSMKYTCQRCNDSYTVAIPMTAHTVVIDKAIAATCTKTGLTEGNHCSVCNTVIIAQEVIPATGHSWDSGTVSRQATCTQTGEIQYTCLNNSNHTKTVSFSALGHKWDSGKVYKAATCTTDGIMLYTCLNDSSHTKTASIAATGHKVVIDKAVEATCTEPGLTEGSHCRVCGTIIKAQNTISALGHTYQNGICTRCGAIQDGIHKINGRWGIYVNGKLQKKSGWIDRNGNRYYADSDGYLLTGWQEINNLWYYFNAYAVMQTGWQNINGKWYYLNTNGSMKTGWLKYSGKWYYLNTNGTVKTGWLEYNSKWYYFDTDGTLHIGWLEYNSKWYYMNTDGTMHTGWLEYNSKWYYLNTNGTVKTGWLQYNSKWYYLNTNGTVKTGWLQYNSKWYYFNSGGEMVTGWLQINGKWYYFNSSGVMQTGTVTINNKTYVFSSNGVLQGS